LKHSDLNRQNYHKENCLAHLHRDTSEQIILLQEAGITESRQELIDAHVRILWEDDENGSGDVIAKISAVNYENDEQDLKIELLLYGSTLSGIEYSKKNQWEIKILGTTVAKVNSLHILEPLL
jgi:hypothetical protein